VGEGCKVAWGLKWNDSTMGGWETFGKRVHLRKNASTKESKVRLFKNLKVVLGIWKLAMSEGTKMWENGDGTVGSGEPFKWGKGLL